MSDKAGEGRVVVAYLHGGEVGTLFHLSLFSMIVQDLMGPARILGGGGHIAKGARAIGLPFARTQVAEQFLTQHDAEWLLWVDTDMGFGPDALERLIEAADPVERPVVGALRFAQTEEGVDAETGAPEISTFPTVYRWNPDAKLFGRFSDYPRDTLVKCDGTGAAFLLIHRTALEKVMQLEGTIGGPRWFNQLPHPHGSGDMYGEDLSFCLRLMAAGVPLHVHTGVKTSHMKTRYLTERLFDAELRTVPTFVVIPARDKLGMTRDLVLELERQGEADKIFVMDHGSGAEFANWFDTHGGIVERVDCADAEGIHEMWNRGLDLCVQESTKANVAILNNDIEVCDGFLGRLARGLRSDSLIAVASAVGPDYDGQTANVVDVDQIAAGKQDGSGFAGWAFMVRGETIYRFPQQMRWWFGDNDLLLFCRKEWVRSVVVPDAVCTHLDGGSNTLDTGELAEQLAADREAFLERWSAYTGPADINAEVGV